MSTANPDWVYEYECDGCAACCVCYSLPVNNDDLEREPALKTCAEQVDDEMFVNRVDRYSQTACPFLTNHGSCGIYPTRPRVCSSFRPGDVGCQYARGRAGLGLLRGEWRPRTIPLEMVN